MYEKEIFTLSFPFLLILSFAASLPTLELLLFWSPTPWLFNSPPMPFMTDNWPKRSRRQKQWRISSALQVILCNRTYRNKIALLPQHTVVVALAPYPACISVQVHTVQTVVILWVCSILNRCQFHVPVHMWIHPLKCITSAAPTTRGPSLLPSGSVSYTRVLSTLLVPCVSPTHRAKNYHYGSIGCIGSLSSSSLAKTIGWFFN